MEEQSKVKSAFLYVRDHLYIISLLLLVFVVGRWTGPFPVRHPTPIAEPRASFKDPCEEGLLLGTLESRNADGAVVRVGDALYLLTPRQAQPIEWNCPTDYDIPEELPKESTPTK